VAYARSNASANPKTIEAITSRAIVEQLSLDLSSAALRSRLAAGGKWIRTLGPAAKMDGRIRFRGRLTEMIKIGGVNVAPVEQVVLQHPDIVQAYVVGHS